MTEEDEGQEVTVNYDELDHFDNDHNSSWSITERCCIPSSPSSVVCYIAIGMFVGGAMAVAVMVGFGLITVQPSNATKQTSASALEKFEMSNSSSTTPASPSSSLTNTTSTPSNMAPSSFPTVKPTPPQLTKQGSFLLLETKPHLDAPFTEGFELVPRNPNQYYESIGNYGKSSIRIVDFETQTVLVEKKMDKKYFGEGVTYANGKLYQLTWQENIGFVYNATTLDILKEESSFDIGTTSGEGWGISFADSPNVFFVSDGTSNLHIWEANLTWVETVPVFTQKTVDDGSVVTQFIDQLNELEWDPFTETILSNVWQTNDMLRIDPWTGLVTHVYNLESLERPSPWDVLNGIAMTDTPYEVWVTGKDWPNMYRIQLLD